MTTAARETLPVFRVFLSHSQGDRPIAERVIRLLAAGGRIEVFGVDVFAESGLRAGERWGERFRQELEACDVFMVIGSPRAATSAWVLQELGGAWALDKPIVVVTPEPGWTWQLPVAAPSAKHVSIEDLERPNFIEHLIGELARPGNPSPG
jgi:hypothetical protein